MVFSLIEQRRLHLTAVCLLRDYLTQQNHRQLLAEASGKTKLQVQELIPERERCAEGQARASGESTQPSHPSRDLAEVIERALDLAIARAENRRFGKIQAHKLLQAEQDFGTEFIAQRRIPSRPSRSSSVVPPRRARVTTCTRH